MNESIQSNINRTIMFVAALLLSLILMNTACSSIDKNAPISQIVVAEIGKNPKDRPEMISSCKGFFLSEKQVKDFHSYASRIKEDIPNNKYEILPCYSTGTAYLYGEKYTWLIRAGGVGEFYNDNDRFVMICGKDCCKKVDRIC